jgi:hypothetical protein
MSTRASTPATTLRGRWLVLARGAWVAVVLLTVGVFVSGIPSEFERLRTPCSGTVGCVWTPSLTAHNARELGLSVDLFAAYFVAIEIAFVALSAAIGVAIFWRRSDDRMALLVSLMLTTLGASLTVPYPLVDLPFVWTLSAETVSFVGGVSTILFLYLFPVGHFVPRWTRWLAMAGIGLIVAATLFYEPLLSLFRYPYSTAAWVGVGFAGTILVAQIYRYRRMSDPSLRQQTKWVVFGIVAALGGGFALFLLDLVVPRGVLASLLGTTAFFLLGLLIPVSIAVAVLRYHLYDIDLIINRTLVYGSLTLMLALLYFGGVTVTQALFTALTGQVEQPQLAIVVSTLVIAALFSPLRRRIQSFIDRSFYRRKYDAAKTLEEFSMKLRDETDLQALRGDLIGVVAETMQASPRLLVAASRDGSEG